MSTNHNKKNPVWRKLMEDPYIIEIDEQWNTIMMAYSNIKEYIQTLSSRTRDNTEKQYNEATRKNQFLLFVKDFEKRKLKSYIFDLST